MYNRALSFVRIFTFCFDMNKPIRPTRWLEMISYVISIFFFAIFFVLMVLQKQLVYEYIAAIIAFVLSVASAVFGAETGRITDQNRSS
jgi:hypothetical protein